MPPNKAALILQPRPEAWCRLFSFSPAGYGASFYRRWTEFLPGWIELCSVQYPGRETRLREAPLKDNHQLAKLLAGELLDLFDRPFFFFGHSMGAWVAFELVHRLPPGARSGLRALFLSARRAPHLHERLSPLHTLPGDEFIVELQRRYGGIPDAILQDRELMALFLPTLQADVTLLEKYQPAAHPRLDIPIVAFGGEQDPTVLPEDLEAWKEYTSGEFSCRRFPGAHFYMQDQLPALIKELSTRVEGYLNERR